MANTTLYIPRLNPVKFYSETFKFPDNYRSRFIDDFSFQNQIRSYEDPAYYPQKWMHDDPIHLVFETDFTDIKVQLVGQYNAVVKSITPTVLTSAIDPTPLAFMAASILVDDVPAGEYFIRFAVTVDGATKYYPSEPQLVCELVENSILIHYKNSTNDFDVPFDTDILFAMRVEGGIPNDGFKPGSIRKVYQDQNLNSVRLSATPFRSYKLVIGGPEGVPNWVADLINRIFACDYVTIDGNEFVRQEGDMERKGEENYPMAGWSFDVREANNQHTKLFKAVVLFGVLDYDGALLLDYDNEPILYK